MLVRLSARYRNGSTNMLFLRSAVITRVTHFQTRKHSSGFGNVGTRPLSVSSGFSQPMSRRSNAREPAGSISLGVGSSVNTIGHLKDEKEAFLMREVGGMIGTDLTPLSVISSRVSDEVLEELSNEHGGLRGFLQARPLFFDVAEKNGSFTVRQNRRSPFDPVKAVFGPKFKPAVARTSVPRYLLPEYGVSLAALARSAASSPTAIFISLCLDSKGTYDFFCDEFIDPNGRRLFDQSHVSGQISEEQANHIHVRPREHVHILVGESLKRSHVLCEASAPSPLYEVCRLSRFLDGDRFVRLASLRPLQGRELHGRVMPTVLTNPCRFELEEGPASIEATEFLTEVFVSFFSAVKSDPTSVQMKLSQTKIDSALATLSDSLKTVAGVRYMVQSNEAFLERTRRITKESAFELEQQYRSASRAERSHELHFFKGKEMRNKLHAAKWWIANPRGSPLQDDDVLEHLVFDMLGDFSHHTAQSAQIRDLFFSSRFSMMLPTIKDAHFKSMNTLVSVVETKYSLFTISRRTELGSVDPSPPRRSRPEIVLEVLSQLPRPFLDTQAYNAHTLTTRLTRSDRDQLIAMYGSLSGFFRAHGGTFKVDDHVSHLMIWSSESKIEALASEMVRMCERLSPAAPQHNGGV